MNQYAGPIQNGGKPPAPLWLLLALVAALCAIPRIAMLFTPEYWPDGDESKLGVMAMNIMDGERPVLFYGSDRGGGHAFEGYILATLFSVFGVRPGLIHAPTIVFSTLIAVSLAWFAARKGFGRLEAVMIGVALGWGTPFLKLSMQVNGYFDALLSLTLAFLILFHLLYEEQRGDIFGKSLLFFFFCGLAFWQCVFSPLYFGIFILMLAVRARALKWGRFLPGAAGFLLGGLPMIAVVATDRSVFYRHLFSMAKSAAGLAPTDVEQAPTSLRQIFLRELPEYFSPKLHVFTYEIKPYQWALLAIFAAALLYGLVRASSGFKEETVGAARLKSTFLGWQCVIVAANLAIYVKTLHGVAPRYFFLLEPCASVLAAFGLAELLRAKGALARAAGGVALALWLAVLGVGTVDSFLIHNRATGNNLGGDCWKVVQFLREKDIKYIYADYSTKWRISFYSKREIIGSDYQISPPTVAPYPNFDRKVRAQPKSTYVFENPDEKKYLPLVEILKERGITYKEEWIGEYVVIYDMSKNLIPWNMLEES